MSKRVLILFGIGIICLVASLFILKWESAQVEQDPGQDPEADPEPDPVPDPKTEPGKQTTDS